MNPNNHSAPPTHNIALGPQQRLGEVWSNFWFLPVSAMGLHVVRVLAGLLFLYWLGPLYSEYTALFGPQGWFDTAAYRAAFELEGGPPFPVGWSLLFLCGDNDMLVQGFWWFSMVVLTLFTLGIATRLTGILTWLVVVSHTANPVLHYDVDYLLIILAFYLMIGYTLHGLRRCTSLKEVLLGCADVPLYNLLQPTSDRPAPLSSAARFTLRLIQVHFALIIVMGALNKLKIAEWWTGAALWYPLHPPYELTPKLLNDLRPGREWSLILLSLAAYVTLAWQLTFPVFAFRRSMRWLLLSGAVVGWLGAAFIWRLPYWGPLYLTVACSYLTDAEWAWLGQLTRRKPTAAPADADADADDEEPVLHVSFPMKAKKEAVKRRS